MEKKGLSLKYKIMLLLTTVPLLLLGSYLILVINIFKKDKIAYIYDSNSNVNRSIAAQTRGLFAATLNTLKPVVQEYFTLGEFGLFSKEILSNETNLFFVGVFESKDGQLILTDHIEKDVQNYQDLIKQTASLNILIQNLGEEQRMVRTPFDDSRLLLIEGINDQGATQKKYIAAILRSPELEDLFAPTVRQRFFLSTEGGDFLFQTSTTENTGLKLFNNDYFKNIQKKKGTEGTELLQWKKKSYLASYNKIGFGNLIVSSHVDQEKATSATKILMIQSLLFGGLLLCITLFISIFGSQSVTRTLEKLLRATQKITNGDFTTRVPIENKDEIGQLAQSFNLMSNEISRLLKETAEKARMEGELKTAQTVQETLFPESIATYEGTQIAGYYQPASECGGDWWYHKQVKNKVILCIGDATGHGASAALITSAARSATSVLEDLDLEPQHIMKFLNRAIYHVSKGKVMMTFFIGVIDLKQGTLTYSNASHDPPFLLKGSVTEPKKSDLTPLMEIVDPRLGQSPDSLFSQWTIPLDENDHLVFYTDGVADVRDRENKPFGERQFLRLLLGALKTQSPPPSLVKQCSSALDEYRQNSPLSDDVTFFFVKYGRAS